MNSQNIAYSEKLDHLRFLAAFAVLMFHCGISIPQGTSWLPLFREGHSGVQLFMVISGLILSMIAYDRKIDTLKFYANRILRIYPLFIAVVSLGYFTNPNRPVADGVSYLLALLPISNLYRLNYGPNGGQLWSIAVELQFYILFPFIILAIEKYGERFAWYLIGFMIALRTIVFLNLGSVHQSAFFTIFGALDCFLVGILAGRFHMRRDFKLSIFWAIGAFVLVNAAIYWLFSKPSFFHFDYLANKSLSLSKKWIYWPTIEAFLFAALVLTYLKTSVRIPFSGALANLGKWSYSIYAWHALFIAIYVQHVKLPYHTYIIGAGIVLPAVVVMSWASYHMIEKPFLDLRLKYTR